MVGLCKGLGNQPHNFFTHAFIESKMRVLIYIISYTPMRTYPKGYDFPVDLSTTRLSQFTPNTLTKSVNPTVLCVLSLTKWSLISIAIALLILNGLYNSCLM